LCGTARLGLRERRALRIPRPCRDQLAVLVKILRSLPARGVPGPRETVAHARGMGGLELAARPGQRNGRRIPKRDRADLGVVVVGNDGDAVTASRPKEERAGAPALGECAQY